MTTQYIKGRLEKKHKEAAESIEVLRQVILPWSTIVRLAVISFVYKVDYQQLEDVAKSDLQAMQYKIAMDN